MSKHLITAGDLSTWGGMDRANYELAWHLAQNRGDEVHLVAHAVASPLAEHRNVIWHRVPRPFSSHAFGAPLLQREGLRWAKILTRQGARVIVNGGNCPWDDLNWVHAVHAA